MTLLAQTPTQPDRSTILNPGPRIGQLHRPRALTAQEKAARALDHTFGPRAVGQRLLIAGIDQWRDHPSEWPGGMDGFTTRFSSRMGRLAVRNSIRLGTDIALKIDPRYDQCECSGFLRRSGHAWKRVIISRSDSGREIPAWSNFTAAYATPWITSTWYPDRLNTWDRNLQRGTVYLGWRGATNMVREFWPEIKRGLPFRGD